MDRNAYEIDTVYERRLGKRLALIEEIRVELGTEGIECPGVLVVGAQSAGKSSVLERLTGIAFPRAENTCTRVPTIVQLQTDPNLDAPFVRVSRHANFSKAVTCNSMNDLQDAILTLSSDITSEVCPIKDEPIHMQYTRMSGPVMTLIDLPGITHVDVKNEAFDIHGVTAAMVKKYVSNENMVVLVVIPANDDFGNSEALRIAQEFDPEGVRTIGVVSKCDMVPERSDIVLKIQMARDSDVKLSLGFIAVRNKGPGEEEIDIDSREQSLFLSHPLLNQLSKEQRGYTALTTRIVDLQSERVEKFIPEAYKMVRDKRKELQQTLARMGTAPSTASERRGFFTNLVSIASDKVRHLIRAENVFSSDANLAARFQDHAERFGSFIRLELPEFLGDKYGEKLEERLAETAGYSLPNFLNDSIFRSEVCAALFDDVIPTATDTLIEDTQALVKNAYFGVLSGLKEQAQFPKVVPDIHEVVVKQLERATDEVRHVTKSIIAAEQRQVYTSNPSYLVNLTEVKHVATSYWRSQTNSTETDTRRSPFGVKGDGFFEGNSNEGQVPVLDNYVPGLKCMVNGDRVTGRGIRVKVEFLRKWNGQRQDGETTTQKAMELQISILCYVEVILERLLDIIPMVVREGLILGIHDNFQRDAQTQFSSEESLERLLSEPARISETRENLKRRIVTMTDVLKKLKAAE